MSVTAKAHIQKAHKRLHVAQKLLQDNEYEDAVSRAYYAMYHAAKAALATVNSYPKTHEGVVTEFGKKLTLSGTLPKELGKNLADTKAARETYEYSVTATVNKTEAETILLNAQTFVKTIQEYQKKKKTKPNNKLVEEGLKGQSPSSSTQSLPANPLNISKRHF